MAFLDWQCCLAPTYTMAHEVHMWDGTTRWDAPKCVLDICPLNNNTARSTKAVINNYGGQQRRTRQVQGRERGGRKERERGRVAEICYMAVLHTHTLTCTHTCHASYLSDSHHRNYDTMTFARAAGGGNRNLKMFAVGGLYIL